MASNLSWRTIEQKPVKAGAASSQTLSLPPIYSQPGHKHALEQCIKLCTEELTSIDKLQAPLDSVEARDLQQMRGDVMALQREFKDDLARVIEPVVPKHELERHRQMIADRERSIRHNVTGLRPHLQRFDAQHEFRTAHRYRVQLIKIPLEVEKGARV